MVKSLQPAPVSIGSMARFVTVLEEIEDGVVQAKVLRRTRDGSECVLLLTSVATPDTLAAFDAARSALVGIVSARRNR